MTLSRHRSAVRVRRRKRGYVWQRVSLPPRRHRSRRRRGSRQATPTRSSSLRRPRRAPNLTGGYDVFVSRLTPALTSLTQSWAARPTTSPTRCSGGASTWASPRPATSPRRPMRASRCRAAPMTASRGRGRHLRARLPGPRGERAGRTNTAVVHGAEPDPQESNNSASATLDVSGCGCDAGPVGLLAFGAALILRRRLRTTE